MFNQNKNKEKQIKQIFEKYVDKKTIEKILSQDDKSPEYIEKHVGYIIILFNEDENQFTNIGKAIDFFVNHKCMIENIESIYIKVFINTFPNDNENEMIIKSKIEKVINEFEISKLVFHSLIYGNLKCKIGMIGSEKRQNYSVILPDYHNKLKQLLLLKEGEKVRLTTSSS